MHSVAKVEQKSSGYACIWEAEGNTVISGKPFMKDDLSVGVQIEFG